MWDVNTVSLCMPPIIGNKLEIHHKKFLLKTNKKVKKHRQLRVLQEITELQLGPVGSFKNLFLL